MEVRWLASPEELAAPDRAALDARCVPLFDTLAWSADFSATVARPDARPAWLDVRDAESSLTLPLWRARRGAGPLGVALVESLSNYYTMRWQPLALRRGEPVEPHRVGAPLWGAAAAALARAGAAVSLGPLDGQAPWVALLDGALAAQGCALQRREAFGNWVAHTGAVRFDEWFARRPAALRNTWRRRGRQLGARARIAFELHGASSQAAPGGRTPRTLDHAIAAFESVYARSWKTAEPHARFMPALMRRAAERGALRLGLLTADDAPIAAQLWLRDGAASVIYKLAYDEAWKVFSPGLALSVHMFRHAIDVDRAALIDYGSGDDAYKRDWMDERRVRVALTAYRLRHPAGALMALRARLRSARGQAG